MQEIMDFDSKPFLSTPSARRATGGDVQRHRRSGYFYPRPPRGGRPGLTAAYRNLSKFLSTPSARRATRYPMEIVEDATLFLSTPSARRATITPPSPAITGPFLSTPSARRATDATVAAALQAKVISIHALREEGDATICGTDVDNWPFLSTPSARRATGRSKPRTADGGNFYPRPPRGGRRVRSSQHRAAPNFYPRPPRGGRRPMN